MKKTKDNCAWRDITHKYAVGCRRLITSENCGPDCPWHQTIEEVKESREQARQNYIKRHGFDGYEKSTAGKAKARILLSMLLVLSALTVMPTAAKAEEEPELIIFELVSEPTPTPMPMPMPITISAHEHKISEIEILARLLWSSPLRDESQKRTLLWVVLNRVDDESGMFGDTIGTVVTRHEFSFFDRKAYLSDENMRIAEQVLNEWKSEKEGHFVGNHVPKSGVYIRFCGIDNRFIEVTSERGGEALRW